MRTKTYPNDWKERWPRLARVAGLDPAEPVVLALSGGVDSVLLLHWLAASEPRPPILAVHVDHGLRGAESDGDARFCADLCRDIGVPFRLRRARLDPNPSGLEERARDARYALLVDEARRAHVSAILTAHHADDGLETLLMRWVRGTELAGLVGPAPALERDDGAGSRWIVRPLLGLRRAEIERFAVEADLAWREDSSNRDVRFTRNRVRQEVLPSLAALGGEEAVESLRAFAGAVEGLERDLSARTASLNWHPLRGTRATRRSNDAQLGGTLRRAPLMRLPSALQRRALWRLLIEGTALAPSRRLLGLVLEDLGTGRNARHSLAGGWSLCLRSESLELHPPLEALGVPPKALPRAPWLPFAELEGATQLPRRRTPAWIARLAAPEHGFVLPVPGSVTLPDGRRLFAHWIDDCAGRPIPRDGRAVELDLAGFGGNPTPTQLAVRWPRAGDRFHPLGGPGHREMRRFLADVGVPRAERRLVPLVVLGPEILWVAGLRPAHEVRIQPSTRRRLRLELHPGGRRAGEESAGAREPTRELEKQSGRQLELPLEPREG
ncbi:MAG: tRNA lysidine(34) synthetase TilS [Planctomycetota bacterium]|nr:tRNA lysidine(34) synthetase TilS [Planctomycetota bacterium]